MSARKHEIGLKLNFYNKVNLCSIKQGQCNKSCFNAQ